MFLPGESHGQRSLACHKGSDTTEQLSTAQLRKPRLREGKRQEQVQTQVFGLLLLQELA